MVSSTSFAAILVTFCWLQFLAGSYCTTFEVSNKCSYSVWLGAAGTPPLSVTGLTLQPGDSVIIPVPLGWSGKLWGRTLCYVDETGKFSCVTGDCGSSTVECAGGNASPPVTVVEFSMNGPGGLDLVDVSVVEGFNLPVMVEAEGSGKGEWIGCVGNLNEACPAELKVTIGGDDVACRTACQAFGNPQFCCITAETCNSSIYHDFFKTACPRARLYAYQPLSTTFPSLSAHYVITFCSAPISTSSKMNSIKASTSVAKRVMTVVGVVISILGLIGCTMREISMQLRVASGHWMCFHAFPTQNHAYSAPKQSNPLRAVARQRHQKHVVLQYVLSLTRLNNILIISPFTHKIFSTLFSFLLLLYNPKIDKSIFTMTKPVVDDDYLKEIEKARRELRALISKKNCAPLMLRLAIEEVKAKLRKVTYADLYQLAGVVAVEVTGGPTIEFVPGRKDSDEPPEEGRLPDPNQGASHLRLIFNRMGLDDKDIVVLSGAHTLGEAHKNRSDFEGQWTKDTLKFDNSYFVELLKGESFKLPTDNALLTDKKFRKLLEHYAQDEDAFFKDYAASHKKLSELGCNLENHLRLPKVVPAKLKLPQGIIGIVVASAVILGYLWKKRNKQEKR
ncbi:hypothetical protein VNO77_40571 [Canavalia gladiata]|uniref:L-ascorbate peroxidase n=1 Tax=Canavalia gladiata TaxID=3824 RepID=A0AAN9K094_CANGL